MSEAKGTDKYFQTRTQPKSDSNTGNERCFDAYSEVDIYSVFAIQQYL